MRNSWNANFVFACRHHKKQQRLENKRKRTPRRGRRGVVVEAKREEDFVKENVDNAAKVLDSIIKETVEQIFVDEVSEEVFDEVDELSSNEKKNDRLVVVRERKETQERDGKRTNAREDIEVGGKIEV